MARIWFYDDSQVHGRESIERVIVRPRKRPEPVMTPEAPWERPDQTFEWPTVLYDEEERVFKVWYEALGRDAGKRFVYGCYAVSADGIRWERPNLGLFAFNGSRRNNICYRGVYRKISAKCVNVVKRAPGDYHLYYWDSLTPNGPPGVVHYVSEDGVRWRRGKINPVVQTPVDRTESGGGGKTGAEDVLRVSYDRARGRFLLSMRTLAFENLDKPLLQSKFKVGFWQRRISLATSDDGEHFTPLRLVLKPELNDPWDVQFYALSPFRHEDAYLGYLQTFRRDHKRIDVELAYSPDAEVWHRVAPNKHFLVNGRPPAVDCGLMHPAPAPVRVGDKDYIYYWGSTNDHQGGTVAGTDRACALCLAVADPLRMAALVPRVSAGHLLLTPIKAPGGDLLVNADVRKGNVKVGVRDAETFDELPGFGLDDCMPVTGDSHAHVVRWGDGRTLSSLRGKRVRFHVRVETARLFNMAFGEVC